MQKAKRHNNNANFINSLINVNISLEKTEISVGRLCCFEIYSNWLTFRSYFCIFFREHPWRFLLSSSSSPSSFSRYAWVWSINPRRNKNYVYQCRLTACKKKYAWERESSFPSIISHLLKLFCSSFHTTTTMIFSTRDDIRNYNKNLVKKKSDFIATSEAFPCH